METTYILFGREATNILNNEGFDSLVNAVKKDLIVYAIAESIQNTSPITILNDGDGWDCFDELTQEQYTV